MSNYNSESHNLPQENLFMGFLVGFIEIFRQFHLVRVRITSPSAHIFISSHASPVAGKRNHWITTCINFPLQISSGFLSFMNYGFNVCQSTLCVILLLRKLVFKYSIEFANKKSIYLQCEVRTINFNFQLRV